MWWKCLLAAVPVALPLCAGPSSHVPCLKYFFQLICVGVGCMCEVGKGVVKRGDDVVVIIFVCIGGAMVWVAPAFP